MFYAREGDWGFTQYIPLSELNDPQRGFVVNNSFKVKAIVKVEKVDSSSYDSKESTGCVGLKNQGATCYMNSLLQTLFHLNAFRKVCLSGLQHHAAASGSYHKSVLQCPCTCADSIFLHTGCRQEHCACS